MIGKTLGPYQILERIGRGGMATVYKAYQPALDRYVAIKVLPAHLAETPGFAARFQREARAVARLEHPCILPVYDFGQQDDLSYLVMRYVEGGTLKDLMKEPLSLARVVELIDEIAQALDYAHRQGIIHRDVKPNNVLIDREGRALLTDFGVARIVEATQQLTGTGVGVGTPTYMSPEQGQGRKVDQRSDVYSLGVVLYEMLTGKVPYEGETPLAVVWKHVHEALPLPREVRPSIPESVERVVLKALAKAPQDRFQTTVELSRALREAVRDTEKPLPRKVQPQAPVVAAPPEPRAARPGLGRLWWLVPVLLAVAIGGGALARVSLALIGGAAEPTSTKAISTATRSATVQSAVKPTEIPVPTRTLPPASTPTTLVAAPFVCEDPLGCATVAPGEPIHLGYLLYMTDPLGVTSLRGVEMAITDHGSLLGHKISLTGEHDGCTRDAALAGVEKLLEDPSIVAVVGPNCSLSAVSAAPVLSKAGLTMVSPSSTLPELTDPGSHSPGFLRVVVSDDFLATAAASYLFEAVGGRKGAIIEQADSKFYASLASAFQKAFVSLGGKIAATVEMRTGQSDAAALVRKLAAVSPDSVFLSLQPEGAAGFVGLARENPELGSIALLAPEAFYSQDFLKAVGGAGEGMYMVAPFTATDTPEYQLFAQQYEARYGEPLSTPYTAHAYDSTKMILLAVESVAAQDADGTIHIGRQALRDALYSTRGLKGLSGTITCNPSGECAEPKYTVYQIRDGQFVLVGPQ